MSSTTLFRVLNPLLKTSVQQMRTKPHTIQLPPFNTKLSPFLRTLTNTTKSRTTQSTIPPHPPAIQAQHKSHHFSKPWGFPRHDPRQMALLVSFFSTTIIGWFLATAYVPYQVGFAIARDRREMRKRGEEMSLWRYFVRKVRKVGEEVDVVIRDEKGVLGEQGHGTSALDLWRVMLNFP